MSVAIASIVEGHGDVFAVPILIRRIAAEVAPELYLHLPTPIRVPRTKITTPAEIERAITLAVRKVGRTGGIIVVQDSEDDCPAELGPVLLAQAVEFRCDVPIGIVLAKFEFEAWFLAAAESLRGLRGLPETLIAPHDPEAIRGAKEWLSHRMGQKYREVLHQPAFAEKFDLGSARRSDSFDKCYREVERLLSLLKENASHD